MVRGKTRPGAAAGRAFYGVYPQLCLQLEIELTDGRRQVIGSDPTWRGTDEGPIRYCDILDGEEYDARRAMPGWDRPGFAQDQWKAVVATPLDGVRLVWQRNEPIRVVKELKPVKLTEPKPGVYVFDVGQNMVGWCRLKLRGPAGTQVTIRHAEQLNADGTIYTDNLRGAPQRDQYILRGDGEERVRAALHLPRFPLRRGDRTACPAKTGRSDRMRLPFLLARRGPIRLFQRLDQPTDAQRRLDAARQHDGRADRLPATRRASGVDGRHPGVFADVHLQHGYGGLLHEIRSGHPRRPSRRWAIPRLCAHPYNSNKGYAGAPAWADAGIIVPWRTYQNYADKRLLEEHFQSARRWVDYVHKHNPGLLWLNRRDEDFGDWLNGDTVYLEGYPKGISEVPKEVLATAFFAHSTEILAKMARVLGRKDDADKYAKLAEGIKAAFNREYVAADGRIKGDTQAGYALALHFNLLDESLRPKATDHLLEAIKKYKDHPSTGIQTTHRMMLELSRNGHHDEASRIVNLHTVPSWGYAIDKGATTIWERWDGYVEGAASRTPA